MSSIVNERESRLTRELGTAKSTGNFKPNALTLLGSHALLNELVRLGGMTIGRATYQPGWRWSEHVGRSLGQSHCKVEHVGFVLAGTATAAFTDGRVIEMRAGDIFHIPPEPNDSWVVGNEPYISLHFIGADHYAK